MGSKNKAYVPPGLQKLGPRAYCFGIWGRTGKIWPGERFCRDGKQLLHFRQQYFESVCKMICARPRAEYCKNFWNTFSTHTGSLILELCRLIVWKRVGEIFRFLMLNSLNEKCNKKKMNFLLNCSVHDEWWRSFLKSAEKAETEFLN